MFSSDIINAVRIRPRLFWILPALLLILAAAYAVWLGWQVNRDLTSAAADVQRLQHAVETGDDAAADVALADLRTHSSSAAQRTGGVAWSLGGHLPVVGDDARGVRLVSRVVSDLSRGAIERLVGVNDDLEAVLPRNGRISIDAVASLQRPVAEGEEAFEEADRQLSAEDPSGYVDRLKLKYRDLAGGVSDAARVLDAANTALTVMPGMLGGEGPRNYLLVFQNNAEIRSSGGLPGAVSLVHVDDGRVQMTRQVAANSLGETATPVLPLTAAERTIYGPQLGTYFLDANFTPDFPRTADLMRTRWEQAYPRDPLDGVISLDPVALSYLLKATGPVMVRDVALTSDSAVDELLHNVYVRYEDPSAQDPWFRLVARRVFDKVSSGVESPEEMIKALVRSADEGRLMVHSFHDPEQSALADSDVAGELVTDPQAAPQVGVYLNDATGAKMSYYLRYDVRVGSTYCANDSQGLTAKARLRSDAPLDADSLPDYITGAGHFGTEPGSQLVLVRLYGPVQGSVTHVELNGKPIRAEIVQHDGRPVATVVVLLKPMFTVDLTWRMMTGPGQIEDTRVSVTPGVEGRNASSLTPSACA